MKDPRTRHADVKEVHKPYQVDGQQNRNAHCEAGELVSVRTTTGQDRDDQADHGQKPRAAIVDLVGESAGLVDDRGVSRRLDADEPKHLEGGTRREGGEPTEKRPEDLFPVGQKHHAGKHQQRERKARTQQSEHGSTLLDGLRRSGSSGKGPPAA